MVRPLTRLLFSSKGKKERNEKKKKKRKKGKKDQFEFGRPIKLSLRPSSIEKIVRTGLSYHLMD